MKIRGFIRNKEGNAAVEFALIAPMLFLLLMGIVEFALVMFATSVIEGAATSASRLGLTGRAGANNPTYGDTPERQAYVRAEIDRLSLGLVEADEVQFVPTIHSGYGSADADQGEGLGSGNQAVTYDLTYDWYFFTPLVGRFFGADNMFTIRASVIVKNEDF